MSFFSSTPPAYESDGAPAPRPDRHHTIHIIRTLLDQQTPVIIDPQGPSMTPWLRTGDHVQIRPCGPGEPHNGHIVLLHMHNRLVLHRLIKKTPNYILVRGDASLGKADQCSPSQVLGIASKRTRNAIDRRLDISTMRTLGRLWHKLSFFRRIVHKLISARRSRNRPSSHCHRIPGSRTDGIHTPDR